MAASIKQEALRMIRRMPDDVSLEDIMYELYFRQRVDRGLREFDEGKMISHEEVKRSLTKWLQSKGLWAK
jgi:predicted transcriptional regulator